VYFVLIALCPLPLEHICHRINGVANLSSIAARSEINALQLTIGSWFCYYWEESDFFLLQSTAREKRRAPA